jgi:Bacterial membrane protein YfhO
MPAEDSASLAPVDATLAARGSSLRGLGSAGTVTLVTGPPREAEPAPSPGAADGLPEDSSPAGAGGLPGERSPAVPVSRWALAALALMVLVPIGFNAVTLWPEVSRPVPSLNDDAVHYLMIQRASEALATGENPVDHWVPEIELGFPPFHYYQHLPHLTVVFLHRLLAGRVELLTVFNLVRYLILLGFPLIVYWSMRRMEFSIVAAAVGAAAASLLSGDGRYGFEYGSYIWRGHGMYTQLWAMPLSFVTLACLDRLVTKGQGYVAAVVACSALAFSHLIYAYMMVISAVVLLVVGLSRSNAVPRLARLVVAGGLAGIISSYMSIPFVLDKAYLSMTPYLQRWKWDSFGAHDILEWLADGDLLDAGRLPVLTVLLALGVGAAVFARTRPARVGLTLLVVWLLLYFGRVTWGRLADLLPMHEGLLLHRFMGGVHLAVILLIGLGGEWLWRGLTPVPERWRMVPVAVIVLVLLVPALQERGSYYSLNTQWIDRTRRAIEADGDARAVLAALRELPPGRTFVGLRADWGKDLRFGDLHFYDLLTYHRIAAATPPYSSWSLNADLIWHFDDHDHAHYEVFNVKYVVAPRGWSPPAFLRPIKKTPRYLIYEATTTGYGEFAAVTRTARPESQTALFFQNRSWFQGPEPGAGKFVRNDFPRGRDGSSARAGDVEASATGPDCVREGKITGERVSPGRIELHVECAAPSTLVLKMTYHPGWRVAVDGREAPAFMLSPSYIGVDLQPGAHLVSAEYRPPLLKTGLLAIGALTLLASIVFRRRLARLEALWPPGP